MKWILILVSSILPLSLYGQGNNDAIFNSKNKDALMNYAIGDTWTYETQEKFYVVGYHEYTIIDTTLWHGKIAFIIEPGMFRDRDYMYAENNKMYFWDRHYQEYIMYFDFNDTTSFYKIPYFTQVTGKEKVATIEIDSISYKYIGNDTIKLQHVIIHDLNQGTPYEYERIVYAGIGAGRRGIQFYLGCGLCDFSIDITRLRCFTSDTMLYSFVPYACDSTWNTVSTIDVNKSNIKVFPNPTTGKVYITGVKKQVKYSIYDLSGRILQSGRTDGNGIYINESGVAILELKIGKDRIRKKIVVIK